MKPTDEQYNICSEIVNEHDVDHIARAAATALKTITHDDIDDVLKPLSDREREIIKLRFGFADGNRRTLSEVAEQLNVTRERIRQIEAKALHKIYQFLKSNELKDKQGISCMKFTYKTNGVCSRSIDIEIENDIVKDVSFMGGCNGNLKGIAALVKGMKIDDVIAKLEGIKCGFKNTSCPAQLAEALKSHKNGQ